MEPKELQAMTRTLQDTEEIKKLHARYAYAVDAHQWDEVAELFTEDAIGDWGSGLRGRYEGRKEIKKFFKEIISKTVSLLRHMMVQPEIEIEGDRARAKWYVFGFGTYHLPEGETPVWNHGKYENELVKEDGKWKIRHLKFEATFRTPYHDGWLKRPSIM